jgi:putative protease
MTKPELLAPAGDFEKLQVAVAYGADAVYLGGTQYNLRANAKNFDAAQLKQAVAYAHARDTKVYVSANIFAHNRDLRGLEAYLRFVRDAGADAVIVADAGVFDMARKIDGLDIHISTQANVTNRQSASFYRDLGAKRVILARELSFEEIREINEKCAAPGFETEVFVHGAMCVSYSGRCLLSSFLAGRDANQGDCAHLCRAGYHLMEEKRPGEYMPVFEDERGTYLFNAKDLCMVAHIPELVASGVTGLKIEGRMKTIYYLAAVVQAYRQAIDDYFASESLYQSKIDTYRQMLLPTASRDFCTGFYFGKPTDGQCLEQAKSTTSQDFLGIVLAYDAAGEQALVEQRNRFCKGDVIKLLKCGLTQTIDEMYDENKAPLEAAPHPQQRVWVGLRQAVEPFELLIRISKE